MSAKTNCQLAFWRVAYLGGLTHLLSAVVLGTFAVATAVSPLELIALLFLICFLVSMPVGVLVTYAIGQRERWSDAWGTLTVLCGYPVALYGALILPSALHMFDDRIVGTILYVLLAMALLGSYRIIGAAYLRILAPDIRKPDASRAA